jgi:hypothetical protein
MYNGLRRDIGVMSGRDRYRAVAGNRLQQDFPIDDKMGDDIDVRELIETHNYRRQRREQVCERIYRKCCNRIRYAKEVQYVRECYFRVPEVQLWGGVPLYQMNQVISYCMIRLKQKGFDVRFQPPDGILINWERAVTGATKLPPPTEEKVVRYQLDEVTTKAPTTLDHAATPAERLLHKGCTKECCVKEDPTRPQRVSRRARAEQERQQQQAEIDRIIQSRGG